MQDVLSSSEVIRLRQALQRGIAYQFQTTATGGGGTGQATIVGNGSPEGAVSATPGTFYWDTLNKSLWIKDTGLAAVGWYQLIA